MSLEQWRKNKWLMDVTPSAQAVRNLMGVADREIADASLEGISSDGSFDHSYDAVRCLCELALHVMGYTVAKGQWKHQRLIQSLQFTLGGKWIEQIDFLDRCRRKRHQSIYERSGVVQQGDADDLLATAELLRGDVRDWLRRNHPQLYED